jgi:hypothetical protein
MVSKITGYAYKLIEASNHLFWDAMGGEMIRLFEIPKSLIPEKSVWQIIDPFPKESTSFQ